MNCQACRGLRIRSTALTRPNTRDLIRRSVQYAFRIRDRSQRIRAAKVSRRLFLVLTGTRLPAFTVTAAPISSTFLPLRLDRWSAQVRMIDTCEPSANVMVACTDPPSSALIV